MSDHYDVIIIGGGMIGLSLALALAQASFSVAVIEPRVPRLHWENTDYDARVSAIHLGTHHFLQSLHVWSDISSDSYSPLERMAVWDALGGGRITFDASDIAQAVLGYIVENREILRVLWKHCDENNYVDVLSATQAKAMDQNKVTLDNGHEITADLIVGADGAHSWLREQMGVTCFEKPYHHHAIVAVVEAEKPHWQTAYQAFLSTGPLGMLPLSHSHQLAMVWSADPVRSEELMSMPLKHFNRELMNRLHSELGEMTCLSDRKSIPLSQRHVKHYVKSHCALVGDAAHTIHPLAGQGANLGFMDVACLTKVLLDAREKQEHIGNYHVLRRYERWRKSENQVMLLAMSGFKSVFSSRSPITVSVRSWGFNAVDRFGLLKKYLTRYATHPQFP